MMGPQANTLLRQFDNHHKGFVCLVWVTSLGPAENKVSGTQNEAYCSRKPNCEVKTMLGGQ